MEQKHYSYTGNVSVKPDITPENVEIKKVEFFVPVRVYMDVDGQEIYKMAHIDYANQKIHFDENVFNTDEMKSRVFDFLAGVTQLPENSHEAGAEIHDQVDRAQKEFDKMQDIEKGGGVVQPNEF